MNGLLSLTHSWATCLSVSFTTDTYVPPLLPRSVWVERLFRSLSVAPVTPKHYSNYTILGIAVKSLK